MVDAWAMGILAYELIVGRPPFEKQSRAATYEHIMYRKPEFPANMSPDAKDFVFTALTKVTYDPHFALLAQTHKNVTGPSDRINKSLLCMYVLSIACLPCRSDNAMVYGD